MLPFVLLLGEFEVARVLPDVAAAADVDVAAADVAVVLMLLLNVELFSVCPADFIWPPHAETRFFCTNAKVRFFRVDTPRISNSYANMHCHVM